MLIVVKIVSGKCDAEILGIVSMLCAGEQQVLIVVGMPRRQEGPLTCVHSTNVLAY